MLRTGIFLTIVGAAAAASVLKLSSPCDSSPCNNGFKCTPIGQHYYTCDCPPSEGENCEHARASRATGCSEMNCQHNMICIMETVYCKMGPCPPIPTCVAPNSDICRYRPCRNGGMCNQHHSHGFTCTCPVGFVGVTCDVSVIG